MTLARMRAILRRRVQEDLAGNWTNSELDELINEAYVWVQLQFYQSNPDGLIHIDYTTLEVGKSFYPWARGFISIKEMAYLDTSDPLGYRDLGAARDFWVNRFKPAQLDDISWSNLGRHFALFPVPPATITNAIRKIWTGTLTLANDNDIPEIPFNHMTVVVKAQMMCYAETGGDTKDLKVELDDYMSGIGAIQPSNQGTSDSLILVGLSSTSLR